jgi:hypothetical protein
MSIDLNIGIDHIDKLQKLGSIGIKKVFCGYIDDEGRKKWPEEFCTLNRRGYNASIIGAEQFKKFAYESEKYGIAVYVTFNVVYTPEQYEWLLEAINTVSSYDAVKGIIISDMGLLLRLHKMNYGKEIVISTGGTTFNSSAVSFYKQFNVKRIVLDRQLDINEMTEIIGNHPDMDFEIFLMFGNCLFIDGFCSFLHCLENEEDKTSCCYSPSELQTHCGFIHKAQRNNSFEIIAKSNKKYNIGFDENIKNLFTGCNLCAPQKLSEFSNNLTYKIAARGSHFINEFETMYPFLEQIFNLDRISADRLRLFKNIFQYECDGYGCYASKKII